MRCQLGAGSPNEVWRAGQACEVLEHVLEDMITYPASCNANAATAPTKIFRNEISFGAK